jgi:cell division inhibitor SepF
MALRDTWHRALVYFGLAEEEHDEYLEEVPAAGDAEPEPGAGDRYRGSIRRLSSRRRRDEIDDTVLRPVPAGRNGAAVGDVRVHLVVPKSFNDAQQVADRFKDSIPVILNLQGSDTDLSKRLIDFASGLTYALDGGMQRIADKVFLLTPRNVEVSAQERARLIEKGFFNQS